LRGREIFDIGDVLDADLGIPMRRAAVTEIVGSFVTDFDGVFASCAARGTTALQTNAAVAVAITNRFAGNKPLAMKLVRNAPT
jgi:hypothetical protein